MDKKYKVVFVCHGNICRSPMAEFIFKDMLEKNNMENDVYVCSRATSTSETVSYTHLDGTITPIVASVAPATPAMRYPTKVDALIAIGPGVDSAIATMSTISSGDTHFFFSTVSFCISGIMA